MPKLGINVATRDANRLIARLKRLKSTHAAGIIGTRAEDPNWSRIWVDTSRSVEDIEGWLWRVSHGCWYAGVFEIAED